MTWLVHMRFKHAWIRHYLLPIFMLCCIIGTTNATRVRQLGLADMTSRAGMVFLGECLDRNISESGAEGRPFTEYVFHVITPVLGVTEERVVFTMPGAPDEPGIPVIIGDSPAMARLKKMIPKLGKTNEAVLITGESGTGKELVAGAIHHRSARRQFPFLKINALELPYRLLESELFGYCPPSLKDVPLNQNGMFAFADGGTVFLKEIWALNI